MRAALKASKKLIVAIASLLASIVLCIGVCLAWFATNQSVDGSGMRQELVESDILEFTVTAYYLNADGSVYKKAATGNVDDELGRPLEVDFNSKGILEEDETDSMRPYTLSDAYATAILFEIKYELRVSDTKYRIYARCPDDSDLQVSSSEGGGDLFLSPLSNSVFLVNAAGHDVGGAGENYTYDRNEALPFVRSDENFDKHYKIDYVTDIQPVVNAGSSYKNTDYLIMDYDPALFSYLSARMLEGGGSLSSRLVFGGDITLGIESYNDDAVVPEKIELCNAESASARFTQEQGLDIISPTWLFKVTYSDGTIRSVSKGSDGLSIDIDTVTKIGDLTAAVSFTDGGETVSTEVAYTLTEGAHTHQYETQITKTPTKTETGTAVLSCTVEGCDQTLNLTLPVLTDAGYRITDNTATVDSAGTGTYTITVEGMTLSFTAPTDPLPEEEIAVTNIILNKTSATLLVNETVELTATVYPANATDKTVTWSTNRSSVATVDENGVVTAHAIGNAVISATAGGVIQRCTITVTTPTVNVTGVTLDKETAALEVGKTLTLKATVAPADATDKSVTWSSDKTSVATVSASGVVTAVAAGTATITATTTDGSKTATCTITVTEPVVNVTGVSLNKTTLTLNIGDTETLTATVAPANATDKTVSWSSDKTDVATVSASGVVTAVAAGTATITVTTTDGNKTKTCTVTVNGGSTPTVSGSLAPTAASSSNVTALASDDNIAITSSAGVRANAVGDGFAWVTRSNSTTITIKNNSSSALSVTVYVYASSDNNGASLVAAAVSVGGKSGTTSTSGALAVTVTIAAGETAEISTGRARIVLQKVEYETKT